VKNCLSSKELRKKGKDALQKRIESHLNGELSSTI
jgi:hypothetical protein